MPFAQRWNALRTGGPKPDMTLLIRTAGDPAMIARTLRGLVASIDRTVPVTQIRTMDDVLAQFALARTLEHEPRLVSQFVRIALNGVAMHDLEVVLGSVSVSDEPSAGIRRAGSDSVTRCSSRLACGFFISTDGPESPPVRIAVAVVLLEIRKQLQVRNGK